MFIRESTTEAARRAPAALDEARLEAFTQRMVGLLNDAGVALMTSIGHRTGLFDVLAQMSPATSQQIAGAAGLNERYVREWLGAMATGGIVECNPLDDTYRLPAEHAARLTRAAAPNNLAATTQWVAVLGSVESRIVECFARGGGVPYADYPRFHDVMAEESAQTTVAALLEHILPLADGLIERLEQGIDVLDIGCGKGRALARLAERFPRSRFTGYDLCPDAIAAGRAEAQARGVTNLRLETRDVAALEDAACFDLVTAFDAIHDQRDPATVLRNIRRALRPEGVFLMQDIAGSSHVHKNIGGTLAPFVYTVSCLHCMSVSLAQGGAGLGAAWGEELAVEMLNEAGFGAVRKSRLEHDILNTYYVARSE